MGKIKKLMDTVENMRMEFYKDESGNVHQVNRIPEDGATGGKHRRVIHKPDGTQEKEDFITPAEYEALKKFKRVDFNLVGDKK